MNLESIERIMKSDAWKEMTEDKDYLDYKIIHTDKERPEFWCMLFVFFNASAPSSRLRYYHGKCAGLCWGECPTPCNFEDNPSAFYRTRVLMFS